MENTSAGLQPVKEADVKISGLWRTLANAKNTTTPSQPSVIYIYQPLYTDRSKNTRCFEVDLNSVGTDDKVLLNPANEGETKIQLSNSRTLNLNDLLNIDVGDPYHEEVLNVKKVDAGATPDQPAWVTLSWPLMFSHREGRLVQRLTLTWKTEFSELSEDGYRGHTTLLLNQLQGLTSDAYLKIQSTSGSLPDEFHTLRTYETKSDNDGFYQLPPLQRVAQVKLQAIMNGKKSELNFQPDYTLPRNQVDMVLK